MRTLFLSFALLLNAQQRPGFGGPGGHRPEGSFAEHRVQDLSRRLDLTESQRTQALAIFTAADRESEPLEDRLEQAHRALRDATRRNASGSEIDQLAQTIGTLTGQLAAINAKADTAFHNTLTNKQREQFPRGPRGRKGPPPFPPKF
ncbi:MAG: periplasmic heavy metal sensor [Acidobacteria bacterium]|nr:periplasmic heavy metal sensor [Acidobacteriota bacterium]